MVCFKFKKKVFDSQSLIENIFKHQIIIFPKRKIINSKSTIFQGTTEWNIILVRVDKSSYPTGMISCNICLLHTSTNQEITKILTSCVFLRFTVRVQYVCVQNVTKSQIALITISALLHQR